MIPRFAIVALCAASLAACGIDDEAEGPVYEVTKTSTNTWEIFDVHDVHPSRALDQTCETEGREVKDVKKLDADKILVFCAPAPTPSETPDPYAPPE